jgi:hypothetical protein
MHSHFSFGQKDLEELKAGQFLDEKKEEALSPIPGSPIISPIASKGRSSEGGKVHKRSRTVTPESKRDSSAPPSSKKSFSDIVESRESSAERHSVKIQKPADFIDDNRFALLLEYLVKPLPESISGDLFLTFLHASESKVKEWYLQENLTDNEKKDIIDAYCILIEELSQRTDLANKIASLNYRDEEALLTITLKSVFELCKINAKKEDLAIIEEFLSNLVGIQLCDDVRKIAANLYLETIKHCCHNFATYAEIADHFTHIDGSTDFKSFFTSVLPGVSEVLKAVPIIQLGTTTSTVRGIFQNVFLAFIASSSILLPYLSQRYKDENDQIKHKYHKLRQLFDKIYENKLVQFKIENSEEVLFIPAPSAQQMNKIKLIFALTWQLIASQKKLATNKIWYDLKEVNFSIAIIRSLINRVISAHLIDDQEIKNLSPKNIAEISTIFASLYLNANKVPDSRMLRMVLDCYFFAIKKGKESDLLADLQYNDEKHEEENSRSGRRKSISSLRGYRSASPPTSGRRDSMPKQLIINPNFAEVPKHIKEAFKNQSITSTSQVEIITDIYDNIPQYYLSPEIKGGWLDGAEDWTDMMQHLANCINNKELYETNRFFSFLWTFPAYYIASLPLLSTIAHSLNGLSYGIFSIATSAISQVWQFYVQRYFFSSTELTVELASQFKKRLQDVFKADLLRQVGEKASTHELSSPTRNRSFTPPFENMPIPLRKISTEKSPSILRNNFLLETDNSLKKLHGIIANVFIGLEEKSKSPIDKLLNIHDTACLTYYIFNQLSAVGNKELIFIKTDKELNPGAIGKNIANFLINKKIVNFYPVGDSNYSWFINRIIGARVDYNQLTDDTFVTALRLARSENPILEVAP